MRAWEGWAGDGNPRGHPRSLRNSLSPHRRRRNPFDSPGMDEDLARRTTRQPPRPTTAPGRDDGPDDDGPDGGRATGSGRRSGQTDDAGYCVVRYRFGCPFRNRFGVPRDEARSGQSAFSPAHPTAGLTLAPGDPYPHPGCSPRTASDAARRAGVHGHAPRSAAPSVSVAAIPARSISPRRSARMPSLRFGRGRKQGHMGCGNCARKVIEGRRGEPGAAVRRRLRVDGRETAYDPGEDRDPVATARRIPSPRHRRPRHLPGDHRESHPPSTNSVDVAATRLRELPAGGRTPLAEGLIESAETIRRHRLRRTRTGAALLVVVTDGRATSRRECGEPVPRGRGRDCSTGNLRSRRRLRNWPVPDGTGGASRRATRGRIRTGRRRARRCTHRNRSRKGRLMPKGQPDVVHRRRAHHPPAAQSSTSHGQHR